LELRHTGSLHLLYVTLRYTRLLPEGAWVLECAAFHQIPPCFILFDFQYLSSKKKKFKKKKTPILDLWLYFIVICGSIYWRILAQCGFGPSQELRLVSVSNHHCQLRLWVSFNG